MKRLLLAVAVAFVLVTFSACGKNDPEAGSNASGGQNDSNHPAAPADQDAATTQDDSSEPGLESLGPSAACYVCHMTFIGEELSENHKQGAMGCTDCHGLCDGHANDENIGATPPDKIIKRDEINAFCRDCHEMHDVPPEQVLARWQERAKARGLTETAAIEAVCTDCHGRHTIDGK